MDDYAQVATLYDHYVRADLDIPFFVVAVAGAGCILELMAGTGRVSEALARTGAAVTCVDRSWEMLAVLRGKLGDAPTNVICADVRSLPLKTGFDAALLPFNSFAELVDREGQREALAEVNRVVRPGGRFVCTLHNPVVRRRTLDGTQRTVGHFTVHGDTWTVTAVGSVEPEGRVARSKQTYVCKSPTGEMRDRIEQEIRFALIGREEFESMAEEAGFVVDSLVGDYTGSPFDPSESPHLIWRLRRR